MHHWCSVNCDQLIVTLLPLTFAQPQADYTWSQSISMTKCRDTFSYVGFVKLPKISRGPTLKAWIIGCTQGMPCSKTCSNVVDVEMHLPHRHVTVALNPRWKRLNCP